MTEYRKTPQTPDEFLKERIKEHEKRIKRIETSKTPTVPTYSPDGLPDYGVQGQIVIADPTSSQPMTAWAYDEDNGWWQIGSGGGGGVTCSPYYYIGDPTDTAQVPTAAVDSYGTLISTLIGTNPGGIVIPFKNSWTNSLGLDAPCSFFTMGCEVFIRGGVVGGAVNTVIFTLPSGFRPFYQTPQDGQTGVAGTEATANIQANGDVVFLG